MNEWETDAAGNLVLWPLLGYDLAAGKLTPLLRLLYARSQAEYDTGGVPLQLQMTPVQARALGQALLRQADILDATLFGGEAQ
jgi:hypothetical protein